MVRNRHPKDGRIGKNSNNKEIQFLKSTNFAYVHLILRSIVFIHSYQR